MFFSGKPDDDDDDDDTDRNAIISVSGRGKSRRTVSVKDESRVCFYPWPFRITLRSTSDNNSTETWVIK